MQTFLPYSDFRRSAGVLDVRRLGKQRVETLQILRALTFEDYGWRNHPAVTMWIGHTDALVAYGVAVTRHWRRAGFSDTVEPKLLEFLLTPGLRSQRELAAAGELPAWIGRRALHRSHQAALLRKDPAHYGSLFGTVDAELPYVWPEPRARDTAVQPISAWVVRVDADEFPALQVRGIVGVRPAGDESSDVPVGAGTRSTKRRRQIGAFVGEIDAGDRIAVPVEDALHIGEVIEGYEWLPDAPFDRHHVRRVRWITAVHRSALRRPVHLQDPRIVFALRGEPILKRSG